MRLDLTLRPGVQVVVGRGLGWANADGQVEGEAESLAFFRSLKEDEWNMVMRTVEGELQRLLDTVDNWLPAAMRPDKEGFEKPIDIVIRIFPNSMGEDVPLSHHDEERALAMIQTLVEITEETSE